MTSVLSNTCVRSAMYRYSTEAINSIHVVVNVVHVLCQWSVERRWRGQLTRYFRPPDMDAPLFFPPVFYIVPVGARSCRSSFTTVGRGGYAKNQGTQVTQYKKIGGQC